MLISNIEFNNYTPILPVEIVNTHDSPEIKTPRLHGFIDTGASECCVPGELAKLIGHKLELGDVKEIETTSGKAKVYSHRTNIIIYHPISGEEVFKINDVKIDFCPGLKVVLLGYNSFLKHIILNINYPERKFSIQKK
jgi:hypothetical protein